MTNYLNKILLLVLIFFYSHLFSQEISKTITISEIGQELFYQIRDVKIINDNLLISDNLGYKVYKYNLTTKEISSVGGKGKGPGEFETGPSEIIINGKQIIISDGAGVRYFHFFNENLEFVNTKIVPGTFHTGTSIQGNIYWNITDEISGLQKINKYSLDFDLVESLLPPKQNAKNLRENSIILESTDSILIIGYRYKNLIQIYYPQNKSFKNITLKELPKVSNFEYKKEIENMVKGNTPSNKVSYFANIPDGAIIKSLCYWKNNIMIVQLGKYTENPYCDFLFLSLDGEIIKKLTLEEKEIMLDVSEKYLVTTGKERTELSIYKIEERN